MLYCTLIVLLHVSCNVQRHAGAVEPLSTPPTVSVDGKMNILDRIIIVNTAQITTVTMCQEITVMPGFMN